ncbi:NUDIX domain-containing protein [Vibrio hannami]|uniref:NUDIX hydrolase n=1 Tax=Vibrio hannami TaxID=2717094 RepID=UPI00240FBC35|nr:NUDIX domain-containing protein [Vibrio hannami]MDG3087784.1 NUDIX domain-containing protein [Vibrio hannami]
MKIHECVSFIIIEENNILLERRAKDKETDPGIVNIPGGHIENGESQLGALFRECKEELNVTPLSYYFLCSLYHPTSEMQLIHYYVVNDWDGKMTPLEAEEILWSPIQKANVSIDADKLALSEVSRLRAFL